MGPNLAQREGKGSDPFPSKRRDGIKSNGDPGAKGSCRRNLLECPLVKNYRDSLGKTNDDEGKTRERTRSANGFVYGKGKSKSDPGKNRSDGDSRSASSNALGSVRSVRSTRAQDLRFKSNQDSIETKSRSFPSSPYAETCGRKKTRFRSSPAEKKQGRKAEAASEGEAKKEAHAKKPVTLVKEFEPSTDSGESVNGRPKKSATFFICKGPKKDGRESKKNAFADARSEGSEEEEASSPRPKPITHNDSFCLIQKSSRNWSGKNRVADGGERERACKEAMKDKGILKRSHLKSVDSLDYEKTVRFSDQTISKKCVRRKRRCENTVNAAWYRRNKLFQKYLQILKCKSVLHAQETAPREPRPFADSPFMRDRYEAEMLGIVPRHQRFRKTRKKVPTEDDDLE